MQHIPKMERFWRILNEHASMAQDERILNNISMSGIERYQALLKKYPDIEQRRPQKHIASFLGMTPVFLSQIRKDIAKSSRRQRSSHYLYIRHYLFHSATLSATATASISISASAENKDDTSKIVSAGYGAVKYFPLSATIFLKFAMSRSNIVTLTTFFRLDPPATSTFCKFSKDFSACISKSPIPTNFPSSSRAVCPEINNKSPTR